MPVVTLTHDGCEPWVSEHDTDAQADAFAEAWASQGWSRDDSAQPTDAAAPQPAPAAPAASDVPAAPPVAAPAEPTNTAPEGV